MTLLHISEACLGPVCVECMANPTQALTILAGRADGLMRLAQAQGNSDVARAFSQVREAAQVQVQEEELTTWPTLDEYLEAAAVEAAMRNAA